MISRIKQLWYNEQSLQGAAWILVVTMVLSNALGFLRDAILANSVPLGTLDTYYAAFRLPDFLFNLFILGAISSAFIPVYLELQSKDGDAEGWRLAHNLVHIALLILSVVGIGLFIFMPHILPSFVPGFDTLKLAQTVPLARILLLSPIFFAVSYVLSGVLNAHKKFFAYALAPLVYNVSIIVGGFLTPWFGVVGVAWAVVIGAVLHVVIQVPVLAQLNYRYSFVLDFKDAAFRRVIKLMIPRSISLGMGQIVLLFFTRLGSLLPSGAVSIFALTNNIQTTPVAVFASSIATAVFPLLGEASTQKDPNRFRTLLTNSLKGMLFYIIPSMILLWVFRAHIIRLYLALNHQTWTDTIRAIDTFGWFIFSLPAQGIIMITIRAFYAKQNTKGPMYIALLSGIISIVLAWNLVAMYHDVPALAVAYTIGANLEAVILVILFAVCYRGLIDFWSLNESVVTALGLSIIAGLSARLTLSIVSEGTFTPLSGLGTVHILPLFIDLLVGSVVGVSAYIGLSAIFRRDELSWLWPRQATQAIPLPDSEDIASDEGLV